MYASFTEWFDFGRADGPGEYVAISRVRFYVGYKGSDWYLDIEPGTTWQVSVPFLEWLVWVEERLPEPLAWIWSRVLLYRCIWMLKMALVHDEALKRGHGWVISASIVYTSLRAQGIWWIASVPITVAILLWGELRKLKRLSASLLQKYNNRSR